MENKNEIEIHTYLDPFYTESIVDYVRLLVCFSISLPYRVAEYNSKRMKWQNVHVE